MNNMKSFLVPVMIGAMLLGFGGGSETALTAKTEEPVVPARSRVTIEEFLFVSEEEPEAEPESKSAEKVIKLKKKKKSKKKAKKKSKSKKTTSVWIPRTGKKYHKSSKCSNMRSPSKVSLSTAKSRGYTKCKKCW